MEFESLIFDIDGTLWDTRGLVAEGWNEQLRKEKLDEFCMTVDQLTPLFGKVAKDLADVLFAALPEPERMPLMERCLDHELGYLWGQACKVGYPGVKETLEALAAKYRLFIVSNSQSGYPEVCMDKLGITNLIQGHLCFGDTRTCKGETIKKLMKDHRIASACYIGDTQGDADAAALAGIPFVYCAYGFGQVKEYWKKIDSFAELLKLDMSS